MFAREDHYKKVLDLWNPIKEKMYWVVLKITNDRDLAEDVLQEALIAAIDKYQTLKDEAKFEPWFVTIAIRKAYGVLAERKIFAQAEDLDEDAAESDRCFDFPDMASSMQYKDMIRFILKSLKPETRRYLFYLKYIEDRPMNEIVGITGMKEGTLKSIYHRMRKELGPLLAKEYDLNV